MAGKAKKKENIKKDKGTKAPVWVWMVVLAVLVGFVFSKISFPDKESKIQEGRYDFSLKSEAPATLYDTQTKQYNFGRYNKPIVDVSLHPLTYGQQIFQKKAWHFIALSSGRYFIGVAVANIGYASVSFIYIFDSETQWSSYVDTLIPLGYWSKMSESSISGCSTLSVPANLSSLAVEICGMHDAKHVNKAEWTVKASGTLRSGERIKVEAVLGSLQSESEPLALAYPIGEHRVAYTHKGSGLNVRGSLDIGQTAGVQLQGVGLIDWTRAMHKTLTVWYWVALTFVKGNSTVGINLSHGVYPRGDTPEAPYTESNDLENAVWVDGKVHVIESKLIVEGFPGSRTIQFNKPWTCKTADDKLHLVFTPRNGIDCGFNIDIVNLRHTFGTFEGWIIVDDKKYEINQVSGIVEDHYAYW